MVPSFSTGENTYTKVNNATAMLALGGGKCVHGGSNVTHFSSHLGASQKAWLSVMNHDLHDVTNPHDLLQGLQQFLSGSAPFALVATPRWAAEGAGSEFRKIPPTSLSTMTTLTPVPGPVILDSTGHIKVACNDCRTLIQVTAWSDYALQVHRGQRSVRGRKVEDDESRAYYSPWSDTKHSPACHRQGPLGLNHSLMVMNLMSAGSQCSFAM